MSVDSKNIYIGRPDQLTTGAVQTAPVGTTGPTNARDAMNTSVWTDSGYVDENGVTLSQERSTTQIKDWSGANVRTLLDEFTGTLKYSEMETTYASACRMVGASNVTKTDANNLHGTQLKIALGPELPPAQAWVFSMKDEGRRLRIYIPNGQVTAVDDTSFVRNDAVKWSYTITANDDGTGHSMYIFTDDGQIISVDTPAVSLDVHNIGLSVDGAYTLTATTTPAAAVVTWTSSNSEIASVADGVVTGESAGTATITAKITVDGTDYTDTCSATVSSTD